MKKESGARSAPEKYRKDMPRVPDIAFPLLVGDHGLYGHIEEV
jgi:hypothetical protein